MSLFACLCPASCTPLLGRASHDLHALSQRDVILYICKPRTGFVQDRPPAVQMLISGTGAGIDVEDMRANVQYAGGDHEEHPLVLNFWKARAGLPVSMQQISCRAKLPLPL